MRQLLKDGKGPILGIDADPNMNLAETIGMEVEKTVGGTIIDFFDERMKLPPGMTKDAYLELKLNELLVEGTGIDLLAMGRGEGAGCYCHANLMLRKFQEELQGNYPYTVVDNEAGMEHLSRRTTQEIDELLVVSDPTPRGIRIAGRIRELVQELKLSIKNIHLVLNRVSDNGGVLEQLRAKAAGEGFEVLATIPADQNIAEYDAVEKPIKELPDDSDAVVAVKELLGEVLAR